MKTALVTGSTGLLGSNLVQTLQQAGWEVKALVRSRSKAQKVFGDTKLTLVTGDMEDVSGFAQALQGVEVVFHTAAYFREYYQPGDHWQKLEKINVKGTLDLLNAAQAAGVKTFIYTSSSGVIAPGRAGQPGDENSGVSPEATHNLYFKSKVVAEEKVADWCQHNSLKVVQILPGWMMGPGDWAPTASGQIILDLLKGKMPALLQGGANTVDPRDVAEAMLAAVEKGQTGERYLVAGRFMSLKILAQTLEKITGKPMPRQMMPKAIALAMAVLSESYGRLTRQPVLMTLAGVRTMQAAIQLSSAKAEQKLLTRFRPLEDTLRDELAFFEAQGTLKIQKSA